MPLKGCAHYKEEVDEWNFSLDNINSIRSMKNCFPTWSASCLQAIWHWVASAVVAMTQKIFASRPEIKSSTDSIGRYFRPKIRIYVLQILLILSRVAYAVVMTQKKLVSRPENKYSTASEEICWFLLWTWVQILRLRLQNWQTFNNYRIIIIIQ